MEDSNTYVTIVPQDDGRFMYTVSIKGLMQKLQYLQYISIRDTTV